MKLSPKSFATGLILLAAAGCAGEGPNPSGPESAPLAAPANPPAAPGATARPNVSAEMNPASKAPAIAKSEPAGGGPAVEGPKTEGEKPGALSEAQLAKIKELPADEQGAAIKQATCPVSGEALGSMGKPVKVTAEGRSFYLCCKSCEKDVKADPKGVLAKLDQKRP